MVALGKVRGNLMIDLHTTSTKLRDRAVRVVAELTQSDYNSAREKLEASGWNLRDIMARLKKTSRQRPSAPSSPENFIFISAAELPRAKVGMT